MASRIKGVDRWKPLAEATVADLRSEAAQRADMARANQVRSAWFAGLADALAASGEPTLGEMPRDAVRRLL